MKAKTVEDVLQVPTYPIVAIEEQNQEKMKFILRNVINSSLILTEEMLKNIKKIPLNECDVEVSLENFMGCGFGVCCACTVHTKSGSKKVCKDGPVFNINELIFD